MISPFSFFKIMKEIKQELPTYWASYLINGDSSGLEDQEEELINKTLNQLGLTNCVDVLDDSGFRWGISYLPDL